MYEYCTKELVNKPNFKQLDEMGYNGWELVSIIYQDHVYTCYFKRIKQKQY